MKHTPLGIYSWNTYLPPTHLVKDLVLKSGGNPTNYLTFGWEKICVANDEDYPLNMCTKALKMALDKKSINSNQLRLVICTSTTHDYPEFCTASDVMKDVNASPECVGFDIYQGCVTTLTALEIARDWLGSHGGGYAAIVSGEKWATSIDKTDNKIESLWNFSDGASALIVGVGVAEKPLLNYHGSCFYNNNEMSGHIRRSYGGARSFSIPTGENPTKRVLLQTPLIKQMQMFVEGYSKVITNFKTEFGVSPEWMICNQGTPAVVEQLAFLTRIKMDKVARTGEHFGHVGCSDLIVGLDQMEKQGQLKGNGIALSCSPSCWAAGLLEGIATS